MSLTGHNMRRALAAKAAQEAPAEPAEPTEAPSEAEDAPKRRGRPAKTEE